MKARRNMADSWDDFDVFCMEEAIRQALAGARNGEVPVGAVLAHGGRIVAAAHNLTVRRDNALAHAEMIVLEQACAEAGRHGAGGATIYVTLEPCVMCAGALVASRIESLVFGARDARFGGCRSVYRITEDFRLNHQLKVREGLLAERCSGMLADFFRQRRLHQGRDSV